MSNSEFPSSDFLQALKESVAGELNLESKSSYKILSSKSTGEARIIFSFEPEADYFVRVTPQFDRADITGDLTNYLYQEKLPVIPVIAAGKIFSFDNKKYRVDIRPYFIGRFFNNSESDFKKILLEITRVHRALKKFPRSSEIETISDDFIAQMELIRDSVCDETESFGSVADDWLNDNQDFLKENLIGFDPTLGLKKDAQCLHGDLHPGNVLFMDGSDDLMFFDFEESYKVYLNRAYDLAYVFERFCLLQGVKGKELSDRLKDLNLITGVDLGLQEFMRIVKGLSLRLILIVLYNYKLKGVEVPISELNKFRDHFLLNHSLAHQLR